MPYLAEYLFIKALFDLGVMSRKRTVVEHSLEATHIFNFFLLSNHFEFNILIFSDLSMIIIIKCSKK